MQTVRPALEAGVSVICDRFDSSTWAYQIVGQEQGQLRHLFYKMRQHYLASVEPDRYVILDVRPEVGLARAKGRGETLTHFDERDLDFHRRVSAGFLEFARALPPDQVTIIDANGLQTRELVLSVVAGLCWGPRRSRQKTAM